MPVPLTTKPRPDPRRQQLGRVRLLATGPAGFEQRRGGARHEIRRLPLRVSARDRELYALILTDWAAEYDTFARIGRRLLDEEARVATGLRGADDPLGVHAVEDVLEPLSLLADEIGGGNLQIVVEHFIGLVVDHGIDALDGQPLADGLAHVDEKQG